jgi:hypothetical protein
VTTRSSFLEAWGQFDAAAERHSATKGKGASTETLKNVTDELTRLRRIYALELGIDATRLADLLASWRRCGRNHDRALRAVEAGLKE